MDVFPLIHTSEYRDFNICCANKQHSLPKIDYVSDYISLNVAEALKLVHSQLLCSHLNTVYVYINFVFRHHS